MDLKLSAFYLYNVWERLYLFQFIHFPKIICILFPSYVRPLLNSNNKANEPS